MVNMNNTENIITSQFDLDAMTLSDLSRFIASYCHILPFLLYYR